MAKKTEINWLTEPEEHDYPAAASYLKLIFDESQTSEFIENLRVAPVERFKAKDLFRASQLSLMGVSNTHVEKDRKKIKKGIALSPLLLVRDRQNNKLVIADGYHRLCAIYKFNEDIWIHCKIA